MTPLKFIRFRLWEVLVPARDDILSAPHAIGYSKSLSWPQEAIHLVEAETACGITAVGESCRGEPRDAVERTLRDLLGSDLRQWHPATRRMSPHSPVGLPMLYPQWAYYIPDGSSYTIVESLWVDAMAKSAGVPAHALFGGAVRDRVAVCFWANRPDAATMLGLIGEAANLGLRGIKLKSDATGDTVRALSEIANEIPKDFRITIDPMCAWRTFLEARPLFAVLRDLNADVRVEDPFPHDLEEDWRRAREFSGRILIYHGRNEESLRMGLRSGVADGFNCGGDSEFEFLKLAAAAEFAGKDCWHGSSLELGVLQALHLHGAACARNCLLESDLSSEWVREHTLITQRMRYEDGFAVVPGTPGLGVSLDRDALERYSTGAVEIE